MKYVITGGAGNISQPLANILLDAGHEVIVIGRQEANLQPLVAKGARAAIGSLEDAEFLTATFAGADAVYTMIPPNFGVANWRHFQNTIARNFVQAIAASQVKNVVVLSSIGAHLRNGAGPIDGLADYELLLQELPDLNVKLLRPSYFFTNLFSMIRLVKQAGIMGANFGAGPLVLVHPKDIATAAAEELLALNFKGTSVRYIAGDERTGSEIAAVLGNAIGQPDITWVVFTDEQTIEGMKQAGLPETIVEGYTTMGKAIREEKLQEDYFNNRPALSPTKLEEFAKEFAAAFQAE